MEAGSAAVVHVERGLGDCPAHVWRQRGGSSNSIGEGSCSLHSCSEGRAPLTGGETEAEWRSKGVARGRSPTHLPTWTARCLRAPEMEGPFQRSWGNLGPMCGLVLGKLGWVTASPATAHFLSQLGTHCPLPTWLLSVGLQP